MAYIQERVTNDGQARYRVQVRLRGHPTQTATFERKTDAKRWAQQVESAIREGRHFTTSEAKRHTLGDLVDRYVRDVLPRKPKSQILQSHHLERLVAEHLGDLSQRRPVHGEVRGSAVPQVVPAEVLDPRPP